MVLRHVLRPWSILTYCQLCIATIHFRPEAQQAFNNDPMPDRSYLSDLTTKQSHGTPPQIQPRCSLMYVGMSLLHKRTNLPIYRPITINNPPLNGGSAGSIWDPRYSINSWIFWSSPISKYSINIYICPNRSWTVLEWFPPVNPPKSWFFSRASRAISSRAPEFEVLY